MSHPEGLKILLIYDCVYPESVGGVEHRNHEMAKALGDLGHQVTIAGFTTRPRRIGPRSRVESLGRPGELYTPGGRRSIREALRLVHAVIRLDLRAFDVVETANIPYLHVVPLAIKCRLGGRPLLVTWYEYWGTYWRRYLGPVVWLPAAAIEWLTIRMGTHVLAVSQLTADRLERQGRGRTAAVLPIGISIDQIRATKSGAIQGAPLIHAGRLQKEKRVDLLLRAVRRLDPADSKPFLVVVGDGPEKESLEALATELNLGGRVVFTGRVPDNQDLWQLMAEAKLAVQPSYREGFGLFPLEAMALGLPVIYCASPENAVSELVRDGREGLSTGATPEDLANAIERLLADDKERERMGRAARARAEEYDWPRIAVALETLLKDLVLEVDR